jgi:hypothetical protein
MAGTARDFSLAPGPAGLSGESTLFTLLEKNQLSRLVIIPLKQTHRFE